MLLRDPLYHGEYYSIRYSTYIRTEFFTGYWNEQEQCFCIYLDGEIKFKPDDKKHKDACVEWKKNYT